MSFDHRINQKKVTRGSKIKGSYCTIAIAFFGSIAIAIAIVKAIFLLVDKLLLLLTEFSNYCYCYWFNFSALCSLTIVKTIAIGPF